MDTERLREMWSEHNAKLDRCWNLNLRLFREHKRGAIQSLLRRQVIGTLVFMATALAAVVWSVLHLVVDDDGTRLPALVVAAASQLAFIGAARQLGMIQRVDLAGPIVDSQRALATLLRLKTLIHRFILLVSYLYLWSLFFVVVGVDPLVVIANVWADAPAVVVIHGTVGVLWIPMNLWLLRQYDRTDLKNGLMTRLRDGSGLTTASVGRSVHRAIAYLHELDEFADQPDPPPPAL